MQTLAHLTDGGDDAMLRAMRMLERLAPTLTWKAAEPSVGDGGPDILGIGQRGPFCVEVKRLSGANRLEVLEGAAASAILWMQRGRPDHHKVVWLEVERVGTHVVDKLGEYLRLVAPEVGWAVVDGHGGARIDIPALDVHVRTAPRRRPATRRTTPVALFSDLNSWMLELLLMRRAPQWAWSGSREPCRNAYNLHRVADVSVASAHRFVKAMTAADHLRSDHEGLELVRVDTLLKRWRAVHQSRAPVLLEARPVFEFDPRKLGSTVAGGRAALGGRYATEQLALAHSSEGRRTVWVEAELDEALEAMDLVRAEPGRGQLFVGRPSRVESCFRGRVFVDEVPYLNPCQLMLETSTDPARGFEQSEYLIEQILDWQRDDG